MLQGAFNYLSDVGGSFWEPPQASTIAGESDALFWFIMVICIFFFLLVAALVVFFCVKYRYREGVEPKFAPAHSTALELTWTFIPTVIVVIIFVYGFKGYMRMAVPPANCREMVVNSSTWNWSFQYPTGDSSPDLHMQVNVPVQFVLTSADVIHDFYVPAFRVKKDIVPGRYNRIWAEPNVLGVYDIFCTQYCGDGHSAMRAKVYVETPEEYQKFLTTLHKPGSPAQEGQKVWRRVCAGCHTVDGTKGIGPSWKNVYKYPVTFADSTSIPEADENYIRSMIVNPNNRVVQGFAPNMPIVLPQLNEKKHDLENVITFIESLSDKSGMKPVAPLAPEASDGTPKVGSLKPDDVLNQVATLHGDAALGEQLFTRQGCVGCHTVKTTDPLKAPCLVGVATRYKDRRDLAANILDPNLTIAKGFEKWRIKLSSGETVEAFLVSQDENQVTIRNTAGQVITYKKPDDVDKVRMIPNESLMPPGLVINLSIKEFASLLDYLESLKAH